MEDNKPQYTELDGFLQGAKIFNADLQQALGSSFGYFLRFLLGPISGYYAGEFLPRFLGWSEEVQPCAQMAGLVVGAALSVKGIVKSYRKRELRKLLDNREDEPESN